MQNPLNLHFAKKKLHIYDLRKLKVERQRISKNPRRFSQIMQPLTLNTGIYLPTASPLPLFPYF